MMFSKFERIEPVPKEMKKRMFFLRIFDLITSIALLIPSFMVSYLINNLIVNNDIIKILLFIGVGTILYITIYSFKYYFVNFWGDREVTYLGNHLRSIQIDKLQRLTVPEIQEIDKSLLFNTVFNEPNILAAGYLNYKLSVPVEFILSIFYLLLLCSKSWMLFLLVLLTIPIYFYFVATNNVRFSKTIKKERKAYDKAVETFELYQNSFSQSLIYKERDFFKQFVLKSLKKWEKDRISYNKIFNFFNTIPQFLQNIIPFFVYGIGAILVVMNYINIGELILSQMIVTLLFTSISNLAGCKVSIENAIPLYERVCSILNIDENQVKVIVDSQKELCLFEKDIVVNNTKLFHIKELNIKENGIYFLRGNNGAGKTMFFNQLAGIAFMNEKEININENISYAIQNPLFFEDTVENNIMLGKKGGEIEEIYDILNIDFLGKEIKTFPLNLSLGQQQKVLLARFFYFSQNRRIWLLDEPTTNLDKETVKQLLKYIENKSQTHIIMMISHDESFNTVSSTQFIIKNKELYETKTIV